MSRPSTTYIVSAITSAVIAARASSEMLSSGAIPGTASTCRYLATCETSDHSSGHRVAVGKLGGDRGERSGVVGRARDDEEERAGPSDLGVQARARHRQGAGLGHAHRFASMRWLIADVAPARR